MRSSTYDAYGRLTQRTSGPTDRPVVWDSRSYEEATGRLASQSVLREGTSAPVLDWAYGYDEAGNVTSLTDTAPGNVWRQCFGYDHQRRLTDAWTQSGTACAKPTGSSPDLGGTAAYWDSFSYDTSGNRTQRVQRTGSGTAMASTTLTESYPGATAAHPHQPVSVARTGASTGSESLSVDAVGQLASRTGGTGGVKAQTLTWDVEGHVASVTDTATGVKTSFVYDADGNRIMAKKSDGSAQLWAGDTEFIAGGTGVVTFTRSYSAGGEPVAIRHDTKLDIVSADHHGTPVVLVDGATANATRRHYSPFGENLDTPAWPADRGFLDKTKDSTGYAHLDARDYDATLGRFISADPLIDFTDPASPNGYAYANNSPLVFSDPSGLCWTGFGKVCDIVNGLVDSFEAMATHGGSTGYPSSGGSGGGGGGGGGGGSKGGSGLSPAAQQFLRGLAPANRPGGDDVLRRLIIARQMAPERFDSKKPKSLGVYWFLSAVGMRSGRPCRAISHVR